MEVELFEVVWDANEKEIEGRFNEYFEGKLTNKEEESVLYHVNEIIDIMRKALGREN